MSDIPGNVENVKSLLDHPAFDLRNPNKVYSLIGGFCGSPVNFHAKDGSGYKFLGEIVLQLDKLNPQVHSKFSFWAFYMIYIILITNLFLVFFILVMNCRWHPAWSQPFLDGGVMMKPGKTMRR